MTLNNENAFQIIKIFLFNLNMESRDYLWLKVVKTSMNSD